MKNNYAVLVTNTNIFKIIDRFDDSDRGFLSQNTTWCQAPKSRGVKLKK